MIMRILVIGSGGREHALAWKLSQSPLAEKIFCAPGNGGISRIAECVDIEADNISGLREFALKEKIDLTVAGPEIPLAMGIADEFAKAGLKIFGPNRKAARLEASKVFSKELMANIKSLPRISRYSMTPVRQRNTYAKPESPAWSRQTAWRPARGL